MLIHYSLPGALKSTYRLQDVDSDRLACGDCAPVAGRAYQHTLSERRSKKAENDNRCSKEPHVMDEVGVKWSIESEVSKFEARGPKYCETDEYLRGRKIIYTYRAPSEALLLP